MSEFKIVEKIKNSKLYSRLKGVKNIQIIIAVIIIAIALLIYFLSGVISKSEEVGNDENVQSTKSELVSELEEVLSNIKGAGKIKVLITYDGDGEDVPALSYDSSTVSTKDGDKVTEKTDTKSEPVMSKDSLVILKTLEPDIIGVIIVAEGGDDATVVVKLLEATKIALGIELDKIRVFDME